MSSLQRRLGRGLVVVLALVFAVHWIAADWVIRAVAEKQMANRLADDAYTLTETLVGNEDDSVGFDGARISSVYQRPGSGHYYLVKIDGRFFPSPSSRHYLLNVAAIGPEQTRLYHLETADGRTLLVFGLGLVKFGHRINISVAEDLSSVDHDITTIRLAYFGLTLVILACAISLQRWDVRRAMRPLALVRTELEGVSKGDCGRIVLVTPAEIRPLVDEINRLLVLVERRLQQSRTAIGNLAHALKTPTAMLFKLADHPVFENHPELREQLQSQTDGFHRCIERELKRARIAGNRQAGANFNPYRDLSDLVRLLKNIYAEKCLDIRLDAADANLHFDREDMLEMLGNLLDNACKWSSRRVLVEIGYGLALTISVADDGPGCGEEEAKSLTQRGLRLDESVKGHGLGLAIVSDIVGVYRGELEIGRSVELGGFCVRVSLPLNPVPLS